MAKRKTKTFRNSDEEYAAKSRSQRRAQSHVTQMDAAFNLTPKQKKALYAQELAAWHRELQEAENRPMTASEKRAQTQAYRDAARDEQFRGADESHTALFDVAVGRLRTRIETAKEAMADGECLIAGTTIDEGYIEYGTARAHATTQEQKTTVRKLLQDLKRADEPFERKCVRQRPADMPDEPTMGDRVQFDRARRQYGLQGAGLGCAACDQQLGCSMNGLGCGDGPCKCKSGGASNTIAPEPASLLGLGCDCGGDGLSCGCY